MAIVRFQVGQDEEKSIVRLNQKMSANFDLIPPGASQPLVKPRSIDDVPILALTFWSKRYGDFELRRIAAQVDDTIKQTPDVSAVTLIGGQRREIRVTLDQARTGGLSICRRCRWSARWVSPTAGCPPGNSPAAISEFLLETGEFLRTADDVRNVVVGVAERQAGLRARRRRGERRRRGAVAIRALLGRQGFVPGGDPRRLQAQGHQRRHRRRRRAAAGWSALRGTRDSLRRRDDHHAQLRRDGRRRSPTNCCSTC